MFNLENKRIVVGITGGIAAYKTIELIRLLRKAQAQVRVVLTPRRRRIYHTAHLASYFRQCGGAIPVRSASLNSQWDILNWRNGRMRCLLPLQVQILLPV